MTRQTGKTEQGTSHHSLGHSGEHVVVKPKVVLDAPTWRDDEYAGGGYRISMRIDVRDAAARLGDDHVLPVRRTSEG